MWTKGTIYIFGVQFLDNDASGVGGVIFAADDSKTSLFGGRFAKNIATDGGVILVGDGSKLSVEGGDFFDNEARNFGGVFSVSDNGNIQVGEGMRRFQSLLLTQ